MQLVVGFDAGRARALVVRGRRVIRWGRIGFGGALDRGLVADREEVARRYKRLLESLGVRRAKARLLVPALLAVGDTVDVPRGLPRSKVGPAVRSLAGRQLGGADHLFVNWVVTGPQPHVRAFAVGVLRDAVEEHLGILEEAGLEVESVELETMALARLAPVGTGLVVHMGGDGIDGAVLFRGGKPNQAWAREGAGSPEESLESLLDALDPLRRETGAYPLVILSGPRASEEDVRLLSAQNVNARLLAIPPWAPRGIGADFAPCLGALLPARRVPLVDLHPSQVPADVRRAPGVAAFAFLLTTLVLAADWSYYVGRYRPSLAALQSRDLIAQHLSGESQGEQAAKAYIAAENEAKALEVALNALESLSFPWQAVVPALIASAGSGVSITSVSESRDPSGGYTLSLGGSASDMGALTAFFAKLSSRFASPRIEQLSFSGGQVQFQATLRYTP